MNLLEEKLPDAFLRIDISSVDFSSQSVLIAEARGWRVEREIDNLGLLRLHLSEEPPIHLKFTVRDRVAVDVVVLGSTRPTQCREYVVTLRTAFDDFATAYEERYGDRLRLSVGRCAPHWERSAWDRNRLARVRWAFHQALRDLAVGPGDAPTRLRAVLSARDSIITIPPDEIPPPLRAHLCWIKEQVTSRPPQHRSQGTLDATLTRMRKQTGAKIAERILAISDAIDQFSDVPWDC